MMKELIIMTANGVKTRNVAGTIFEESLTKNFSKLTEDTKVTKSRGSMNMKHTRKTTPSQTTEN